MKKFNYLFTLCAILFGFTINAQNITAESSDGRVSIGTGSGNFDFSIMIGHTDSQTLNNALYNTGIGVDALDNLKQGDYNTAVGFGAGSTIGGTSGTGSQNTVIGHKSGFAITTGQKNTFVGSMHNVTDALTTGNKNTMIGWDVSGDATNAVGRIGIGTEITVTTNNTAVIGSSSVTKVMLGGNDDWDADLYTNAIYLENSESITNATNGTIAVDATTTTFSGNVTVSSDMRLKDNIYTLGNTMSDILKLDGKSYTREGRKEIGLLAQDVELVYPELVSSDAKGMLSVNYQALSAILINGVKDQETRIAKQEERIVKLEILVNLLLNGK